MAIRCDQRWEAVRQELALALFAAGLVANVAWLALGGWMAAGELRHLFAYASAYCR